MGASRQIAQRERGRVAGQCGAADDGAALVELDAAAG